MYANPYQRSIVKFDTTKREEILCYCIEVPTDTVIAAIKAGHTSLKGIKAETAACTGSECATKNPSGMCCSRDIKALIALYSDVADPISCDCG